MPHILSQRGRFSAIPEIVTGKGQLRQNDQTGAIDLVLDPASPNTLYAATWQRVRKRWNDPRNESHYTGSGIHRSTNGGKTWRAINQDIVVSSSDSIDNFGEFQFAANFIR